MYVKPACFDSHVSVWSWFCLVTGFADVQINYGVGGDYPIAGDWDGDGTATIGIFRNGTFYLRNSNTIGYAEIVFALGVPGDLTIAGNWDGLP